MSQQRTVCGLATCNGRMVPMQYGDGMECSICGWMPKVAGRRAHGADEQAHTSTHDGRCMHEHDKQRCPMPGNISDGSVKVWHCQYHSRAGNLGHSIDQDEFYRYVSDPERRQLLLSKWYPGGRSFTALAVEELRKGQPQWERQRGESNRAYAERMLAEAARIKGNRDWWKPAEGEAAA